MDNTLADKMMREQGLEYSAKLPDGHIVRYLSKETAQAYYLFGAEIYPPRQGPCWPRYQVA